MRVAERIDHQEGLRWLQRIYQQLILDYIDSPLFKGDFANWEARETICRLQGELYAEMRKGE